MRFKAGQEIVCITKQWNFSGNFVVDPQWIKKVSPRFNEVVTVEGYKSNGYVLLEEYNYIGPHGERIGYNEMKFQPLITDSELEELLSKVPISQPS